MNPLLTFSFLAEAQAPANTRIAAVHAVIVALRYLAEIEKAAQRERIVKPLIEHAQWQLTPSERAFSQQVIEQIEKIEKAPLSSLKREQAYSWMQILAELADQLSRTEVSIDEELGRRLLVRFRGRDLRAG